VSRHREALHAEVVIVGSGFAGTILARVLHRCGRRVVLVERGRHPRFALGESSTPLASLCLERLAARYGLPDLHSLSCHGRWRAAFPHLRHGLKRGFTFYRHALGTAFVNGPDNEARLLVAASPGDAVADTHWLRADLDRFLVERAVAEGVPYLDHTELTAVEETPEGLRLVGRQGGAEGRPVELEGGLVVDASGPGGFLARALGLRRMPVALPPTSLVYSHFTGVAPFVGLAEETGAVLAPGPYPDELAAVHHLLDEGWMYVLRFDQGPGPEVVSAGVVLQGEGVMGGTPAERWARVLDRYPTLWRQFTGARPLRPLAHVPHLAYRLERAVGPRWVVLPHTYAFFDPLFSTGNAWSLLAVERLAAALAVAEEADLEEYGVLLAREADALERLVVAAYAAMRSFPALVAVSFLYFAAVSFAESRQRLLPEAAPDPRGWAWEPFLGAGDPVLEGAWCEALRGLDELAAAGFPASAAQAFAARLGAAIAPRNIAGLADPRRRNLYPADPGLLVERAHLLGLEPEEVRRGLPRLSRA
jgi:FADH2 O2-dependent halogenase